MDKINLNHLLADFAALKGRTIYQWSAKASADTPATSVHRIDCSGFIKYLLERRGISGIPDGSIAQKEWFQVRCEKKDYFDVLKYAGHDSGRLFVAGFAKDQPSTHRHIWFVYAGRTMESGGALHGVGSRDAEDFAYNVKNDGWCAEIPVEIR